MMPKSCNQHTDYASVASGSSDRGSLDESVQITVVYWQIDDEFNTTLPFTANGWRMVQKKGS
jgi:hypothetical protein